MIETIKIEWDLLGAKFARLSDEDQARFFKGFAFELGTYESAFKRDMQMSYVNGKLTAKEKKILEETLPMLWYKE